MDKKGQVVSLGLTIIFALAVCVASLYTFIAYGTDISKPMQATSQAIKTIDFDQQYVISTAYLAFLEASQSGLTKDSFRQAALSHDMHIDGQGNFFLLIDENNFSLEKQGNYYTLSVPNIFVSADADTIKIKRSFDLSMEFNDKGEFIRFINK